jgi:hypothetical protein
MKDGEIIIQLYSCTYFSPAIAYEIVKSVGDVLNMADLMLQWNCRDDTIKSSFNMIPSIEESYKERSNSDSAIFTTDVEFLSAQKNIFGYIQAVKLKPDYLDKFARSRGLRFNSITISIRDTCIDAFSKVTLPSLFIALAERFEIVYGFARSQSLIQGSVNTKMGNLSLAGGLRGLFWINYFGEAILSSISLEQIAEDFEVLPSQSGSLVTFKGREEVYVGKSAIFMKQLGLQYFWPIQRHQDSRSGTQSVFSWVLEIYQDQKKAQKEIEVFSFNYTKMTTKSFEQ